MEAGKDEAQPVGDDTSDWDKTIEQIAKFQPIMTPGVFRTYESFVCDEKPFATEIIGLFLHHLAYITNPQIKELNDFPSFGKIAQFYTMLARLPTIHRKDLTNLQIKRQYKLLQDLTKAFLRDTFNVNNIERVNIPEEAQMLWNVKVANAAENVLRESFPEQWLQLQFGRQFALMNQAANEARARMPPSKNSTTAQLRKQSEEALNKNPKIVTKHFIEREPFVPGEYVSSQEEGEIDLEPAFDSAKVLASMASDTPIIIPPEVPVSELYTERGD